MMPDNITPLDCCDECFAKLNTAQRLLLLQEAKHVKQLTILANVITEHIRSGEALRGKIRENEGN